MTTTLYEGTKRVHAKPMNRGDYNVYRGWEVPADENPADEGYLVEYVDGGRGNDSRHAGYISWSQRMFLSAATRKSRPRPVWRPTSSACWTKSNTSTCASPAWMSSCAAIPHSPRSMRQSVTAWRFSST